jgi:hypothetical protein
MFCPVPEDVIAFLFYLRHEFSIKLLICNTQENEFLCSHGNTFNIHFVDGTECRSTVKWEQVSSHGSRGHANAAHIRTLPMLIILRDHEYSDVLFLVLI